MVADNHVEDSVEETGVEAFLRVRGWGRISYLPDPEALQDQIGEIIGQALTEFWLKHKGVEAVTAIPTPDRLSINKRGEVTEDSKGRYVRFSEYMESANLARSLVSHVRDQEETIRKLSKELEEVKQQNYALNISLEHAPAAPSGY
jgi:hypothetical protein